MRRASSSCSHELLVDLDAHGLQRADVAVELAGVDARHPVGEPAEVADQVPDFVGGLRRSSLRLCRRPSRSTPGRTMLMLMSGGSLPEGARRGEATAVPAVGRDEHRARIVLEHPAGEVAARPVREVGGLDRGARALRCARGSSGGAPRSAGRGRARGRRGRGSARPTVSASPPAAIASAPRACRSRSPARSLRRSSGRRPRPRRRRTARGPSARRAGVVARRDRPRAHRLGRDRASGRGCRGAPVGASSVGPERPSARVRCDRRRASTPKPTLAPPPGSGNTHAYPGSRSRSKSTHSRSSSTPVEVLAHRVPLPRSRGASGCERAGAPWTSDRRPRPDAALRACRRRVHLHAVGGDDRPCRPPRLAGRRRRPRPRARRARRRGLRGRRRPRGHRRSGSGSTTSRPLGETRTDSCTGRYPAAASSGAVESEPLEEPQRLRGQAVTARLVAREAGLVDAHDRRPAPRGRDRGRGAGGPGTDHDDVEVQRRHAADGIGRTPITGPDCAARFDVGSAALPESRVFGRMRLACRAPTPRTGVP